MKFTRHNSCDLCILKCDIHPALKKAGKGYTEITPLHAQLKKHDIICKQGTGVTHAIFLVKGSRTKTGRTEATALNIRKLIVTTFPIWVDTSSGITLPCG